MTETQKRFIAFCNGLRLGIYTHRENAGRRLLVARRRMGGRWRKVRAGVWRNREGLTLRIQPVR